MPPTSESTPWPVLEAVLRHAMDLPEDQRNEYLRGLQAGNPSLHNDVLQLLASARGALCANYPKISSAEPSNFQNRTKKQR